MSGLRRNAQRRNILIDNRFAGSSDRDVECLFRHDDFTGSRFADSISSNEPIMNSFSSWIASQWPSKIASTPSTVTATGTFRPDIPVNVSATKNG